MTLEERYEQLKRDFADHQVENQTDIRLLQQRCESLIGTVQDCFQYIQWLRDDVSVLKKRLEATARALSEE